MIISQYNKERKKNICTKSELHIHGGDEEYPEQYGVFETAEKAYEEACALAGREAYVQNEEMKQGKEAEVFFNGYEKSIDLHYLSDDTYCHYRIEKKDEY